MARSRIRRRHEAERERIAAYEATLRQVVRPLRQPPDFKRALDEAFAGLGNAIRHRDAWRPQLKTRDPGRLRLAAARHLFAVYPVAAHIELIWLDASGLDANEIKLRKRWYIAAAGGQSLYKLGAGEWLTRKEVHCFLNPPAVLDFCETFWLAIARTYADDLGVAQRIARSKISRTPRGELAFWREAARFFAVNPLPVEEIDDLCDYFAARLERDRQYSLGGRTLASLERQMRDWHRDIAMVARIRAAQRQAESRRGSNGKDEGGWAGSPLANWSWRPSDRKASTRGEEFAVVQITKADDLVAESRAMHHCVWTYAAKCIAGHASIWSLRRKGVGRADRMLTIELDPRNRAVQVRGFGNRTARQDELQILGRWAQARGVTLVEH
ncbi:MAG: PcfJ domain-containing protein [Proteobacteria bacterium]|nr:PcfJ domain-containing protein [Pseudomonadota bacterium]